MRKGLSMFIVIMVITVSILSGCLKGEEEQNIINTTKVPELIWWQIGPKPVDSDKVLEVLNKYTSEKIGVKVDIKYADWGEWELRFPTIVLSGENFDMMFTDHTYYSVAVRLDAFADITDVIENEAPDLKNFIPDILWQGVKVNGRIYSVPTYKDSSQTQYWVWDEDLVKELNIDYKNIVTFDELDVALRKIKEAYPSKYPLYIDQNGIQGLLDIYDSIGGLPVIGISYSDKDAKVVNVLNQPDIRKNLNYVYNWYNEGLIDPNAPTIASLPKYKIVYSQQGFEGADTIWAMQDGYNVVSNKSWGPFYSTRTIQGSLNTVFANSKHIKEAVKYLEFVNTDAIMRNLLAYGIEGEHYKKTSENTVEYLNENYRPILYSQGTFFNLMPVSPNPSNQWELVRKQNETASTSPIIGFTFDETNVRDELINCKAQYESYKSQILTGVREPNKTIEELNTILYDNGLQKIIDEAQMQVDKFLNR